MPMQVVCPLDQQVTESAEAEHECARTDDCNSRDSPAVNPAGCSGTDGEGDAVHGGEESDGRHGGCTDLDGDAWDVGQHRVVMLPMRLTRVAPIRKHQKKRTARWWFLCVISVWVVIVPPPRMSSGRARWSGR